MVRKLFTENYLLTAIPGKSPDNRIHDSNL